MCFAASMAVWEWNSAGCNIRRGFLAGFRGDLPGYETLKRTFSIT